MAVPDHHAELAQLRCELVALRAKVERPWRFRRLLSLAVVVAIVVLLPLTTLAAPRFTDLDPAQNTGHNPDIELIAGYGITRGCTSPTTYCPKQYVTREQMGSFLARMLGLGGHAPVVNANTLGGYAAADLVRVQGVVGPGVYDPVSSNPTPIEDTYALDLTKPVAQQKMQPIAAVTITAPSGGYLLVIGQFQTTSSGGTIRGVVLHESATNTLSPGISCTADTCSLSPNALFPVAAGQHTVEMRVVKYPAVPADVGNVGLNVVFIPFNGAGVVGP